MTTVYIEVQFNEKNIGSYPFSSQYNFQQIFQYLQNNKQIPQGIPPQACHFINRSAKIKEKMSISDTINDLVKYKLEIRTAAQLRDYSPIYQLQPISQLNSQQIPRVQPFQNINQHKRCKSFIDENHKQDIRNLPCKRVKYDQSFKVVDVFVKIVDQNKRYNFLFEIHSEYKIRDLLYWLKVRACYRMPQQKYENLQIVYSNQCSIEKAFPRARIIILSISHDNTIEKWIVK